MSVLINTFLDPITADISTLSTDLKVEHEKLKQKFELYQRLTMLFVTGSISKQHYVRLDILLMSGDASSITMSQDIINKKYSKFTRSVLSDVDSNVISELKGCEGIGFKLESQV